MRANEVSAASAAAYETDGLFGNAGGKRELFSGANGGFGFWSLRLLLRERGEA